MGKVPKPSLDTVLTDDEHQRARVFARFDHQGSVRPDKRAMVALVSAIVACRAADFSLSQVVSFVHEEWKRVTP